MTNDDLTSAAHYPVSRETYSVLESLVSLVRLESSTQNLISLSTIEDIWTRHVVDSIQLLRFAGGGKWLDLGTGAGFPGLVIAAFGSCDVTLVEERRLRHEFLARAVTSLGLSNVQVIGDRIERVDTFVASIISARAFAPLEKILRLSSRFSTRKTRWILPKGKNATEELASIRATWHGDFRLEPSVTDPTSSIIIAENVSPKGRR
ncbi:16S rRNA (guanine(527)-N(7))-methyltransferase RsmG [Sphingomonas paeninsulae]|uniref:Ribosomal RNA small subunit methyltransferase G n=1 Tax=Sphingomonas paeninsulae TaxID=2319844 RepID=A0A494TB48_SPHPE|nr:16S rRNA (guanine(527)-N(7))-methyltransferase RsmG [Sphingomonas paeninsulae]AYJ86607.1 16S rRNA (guanine(527)-N(7))-methyltransferase RsmG [Sphingomonas paeninsulae]